VADKQAKPTTTELRNWLKERLPEYMVPAAFVLLEAMPVTGNGKLDRGSLPAPEGSRLEVRRSYMAPRTEVEEKLARICGEVLKLERIGIHDNFFELGGHSLMATQVVSRIRDTLGVDVPLLKIFENPVLADFARVVSQLRSLPGKPMAPAIKRREKPNGEELLAKLEVLSEQEIGGLLNSTLPGQKE